MVNKRRVILGGALLGALVGLVAALLITRRAEKNDRETAITTGEGIKIGALVFGLLRAIASLGDD
jgi:gas vesicle protein